MELWVVSVLALCLGDLGGGLLEAPGGVVDA